MNTLQFKKKQQLKNYTIFSNKIYQIEILFYYSPFRHIFAGFNKLFTKKEDLLLTFHFSFPFLT